MEEKPLTQHTDSELLQTKLYAPRLPGRLVARQRLIERLNLGLNRPFTLISAPAGYGKTTLVSQWLETIDRPRAWLSLDEHDNSLAGLAGSLLAAVLTLQPALGRDLPALLGAPELPTPQKLADSLLRDLASLPEPVVLAVDDYHVITDAAANQLLSRVVDRLPPTVHLVLISRSDPPFALARLRGHGLMLEVRAGHLRFDYADTAALLQILHNGPMDEKIVHILEERTEGWVVGLRLAFLSLQESPDPDRFIQTYARTSGRLLIEYMIAEVLDRLPENERRYLLQLALPDRFCAPLLAAMTDPPLPPEESHELLQRLWRANLFLVALDDRGVWYRFHQLFRDLLRQQLRARYSGAEIEQLAARASLWFEKAGHIEESLRYALQAGDPQRAGRVVEAHLHEALNDEDWRRLQRWLDLLPDAQHKRPGIAAARLAVDQVRYSIVSDRDFEELDDELAAEDNGYSPAQRREIAGILNTYRGTTFLASVTVQDALRRCELALQQLPPHASYVRSLAEFWQTTAMQMAGKPDAAVRLAETRLRDRADTSPARVNRLMLALNGVYFYEANVGRLLETAPIYQRYAARTGQLLSVGWSAFLLGWSAYQQNDLEGAQKWLGEVRERLAVLHLRTAVDSLTGLALSYHAQGREAQARDILAELRELLLDREVINLLPLVETLAWRLGLADEHVLLTTRDLSPAMMQAQLAADFWEVPALTMIRADIESGVRERIAAAAAALAACHDFTKARNNKRVLLRIGALQALLLLAEGKLVEAAKELRATVLQGEQGGALREILDIAPALYPMLHDLAQEGVAGDYLARMLAAYQPPERLLLPETVAAAREQVELAGLLTYREVEVLLLVERRLSNQQIAQQLYLSPHTVKKHTVNIYRKLGVRNRREAVAQARAMHLLPHN